MVNSWNGIKMRIKDKDLYKLFEELAFKYVEHIDEAKKNNDKVNTVFYDGKLDTILELCMIMDSSIFDELHTKISLGEYE